MKAIAAGKAHSLALLSNGTVMAWGNDEYGQLGNGTTKEDSEVPVAVKGLSDVRRSQPASNFSLALLNSGTVMAWGQDNEGQLGNGTIKGAEEGPGSNVPVPVKGLTGVTSIAAGGEFALALSAKAPCSAGARTTTACSTTKKSKNTAPSRSRSGR